MTTKEIIEYITSQDRQQVWESACKIIDLGQDHEKIVPFIEYLPQIKERTVGLDMGGGFAPNQRFIDFAVKTIEFHKENKECSCALFVEKYKLTNDDVDREMQYECFNPKKEVEKGNIEILEEIVVPKEWIIDYVVKCLKCGQKFKVEQREYHYTWWHWIRI